MIEKAIIKFTSNQDAEAYKNNIEYIDKNYGLSDIEKFIIDTYKPEVK